MSRTEKTCTLLPVTLPPMPKRPPGLRAHRCDSGHRTVLTLIGELDLDTTALLVGLVRTCLDSGARAITVDLSDLTFCDISGLNALLTTVQASAAVGAQLRLENPNPLMRRLVTLTDTGGVLLSPLGPADSRPTAAIPAYRQGNTP